MRLRVKGKNVEVSTSIREYAEAKLSKLSKQLAEQTQVELELWEEKNPSISASHVAEATIFTKGTTLRKRLEHRLKSAVPGAQLLSVEVNPARGAIRSALRYVSESV